jgi:hypothetical protein
MSNEDDTRPEGVRSVVCDKCGAVARNYVGDLHMLTPGAKLCSGRWVAEPRAVVVYDRPMPNNTAATARQIQTADGWHYELTEDDVLWCARMLVGEGGNNAATLWTMASRLALLAKHKPGLYPTLTALVRAYSEPINPKFQRDGELCRPGGHLHDAPACMPGRLDRRAAICALDPHIAAPHDLADRWSKARVVVASWVFGGVQNPAPRAVHFAVPSLIDAEIRRGECSRVVLLDGNAYASTKETDHWPRSFVTLDGAGDA